jgi:hypothetical protein
MRTITTTLYLFDELPTEKAKEKARDWWRNLEAQDPAWRDEHNDSVEAALKFIDEHCADYATDEEAVAAVLKAAEELKKNTDGCPWTGYCGDATAIEEIIKACDGARSVRNVRGRFVLAMEREWDKEFSYSMEAEHVDDNMRANEYEFTEDGKHVS